MTDFKVAQAAIVTSLMLLAGGGAAAQEEAGKLSVRQVSEHVYRWGDGTQYGAYVHTPAGAIVIDGHYCHTTLPRQLKAEITRRHEVAVKYVVLSHDHQDHICNTGVYGDTAVTIGHRNILPHILREKRNSSVPTVLFERELDIELGGVRVTLLYFGPTHSDNLIQIHIPGDKVLVSIDMAKGKSLFPDYRDMDVHNTLKVLKILANMEDVEIVLPGHGPVTDQENFGHQYAYLKALRDEVLARMVAGESLVDMKQSITMEAFRDYGGHRRFLDKNIVTMYHYLYHYREPNSPITWDEAVTCYETAECRTAGE